MLFLWGVTKVLGHSLWYISCRVSRLNAVPSWKTLLSACRAHSSLRCFSWYMAGVVGEVCWGAGGEREEEEDERSCCGWPSILGSLHLLSSAPKTASPPAAAFCLLTFQGMQPSSCSPPRPFSFHSPAGYGVLPIPGRSPPPRPPPPAPLLPPQLPRSGRYIGGRPAVPMAAPSTSGKRGVSVVAM